MAKKNILIKPLITEKSETLSEDQNKYTFVVDKRANKIEIKNAVEDMYSVSVENVRTMIMPGRFVSRSTKSGILQGRKSAFKKAIITLNEGEEIDFFGDL
jgi:large subunit ribosomal protein L23